MPDVVVPVVRKPFTSTISPPGSKSLTNRAMVLGAMAKGKSVLSNVLFADDTAVMIDCLSKLGFGVEVDRDKRVVEIEGRGGEIPSSSAELYCGNSGTTIRFVAALCSLGRGVYGLDGNERMRQRPIRGLIEVMKNLGVRARYRGEEGFPPVEILASTLPGGLLRYGSEQSSQYLSAVLMAAPYARNEVRVDLTGEQTSWPYVAMTMQLMDEFGHTPELERDIYGKPTRIVVPRGAYAGTEYAIEPDASNASYFLAAAAIHEGAKVTIEGLGKRSLQGDVAFADVLHEMGADLVFGKDFITVMGTRNLNAIEVDLLSMPDMAQTLAVVALFASGETVIRGLHTLKLKETDRIAALAAELTKLGARVEAGEDYLAITPPAGGARPAAIDTYDDHRMAMSFAVAGTKVEGVVIRQAECVNKTYPGFFDDLSRMLRAG
jgi:3-phosphoshikimate 1-carboxyvinyltransferase